MIDLPAPPAPLSLAHRLRRRLYPARWWYAYLAKLMAEHEARRPLRWPKPFRDTSAKCWCSNVPHTVHEHQVYVDVVGSPVWSYPPDARHRVEVARRNDARVLDDSARCWCLKVHAEDTGPH